MTSPRSFSRYESCSLSTLNTRYTSGSEICFGTFYKMPSIGCHRAPTWWLRHLRRVEGEAAGELRPPPSPDPNTEIDDWFLEALEASQREYAVAEIVRQVVCNVIYESSVPFTITPEFERRQLEAQRIFPQRNRDRILRIIQEALPSVQEKFEAVFGSRYLAVPKLGWRFRFKLARLAGVRALVLTEAMKQWSREYPGVTFPKPLRLGIGRRLASVVRSLRLQVNDPVDSSDDVDSHVPPEPDPLAGEDTLQFTPGVESQGLLFQGDKDFVTDKLKQFDDILSQRMIDADLKSSERLNEFRRTLGGVMVQHESALARSIEKAEGAAKSWWDSAFADVSSLLWIIPLVAGVYTLALTLKLDRAIISMLTLVLSMMLPFNIWPTICKYFERLTGSGDVTVESQAFDAGNFSDLGSVITSCFTLAACKGDAGYIDLDELNKRMSFFEKTSSGWGAFVTFATRMFEKLIKWFSGYFGVEGLALIETGNNVVESFCARVLVLQRHVTQGGVMDSAFARRVVALNSEAETIAVKYSIRMLPLASRILQDHLRILREISVRCAPALSEVQTTRIEPIGIMLHGPPGIGKSLISPFMLQFVIESVLTDEQKEAIGHQYSKQVFCKSKSEYWEGYHGQKCYVIDDFAQKKEVVGSKADDFMELIQITNTWRCPLNMAFADKGLCNFMSEIVLCTTNVKNMEQRASELITDPAAVRRRFKFYKTLVVQPSYRLSTVTTKEGVVYVDTMLDYPKWRAQCVAEKRLVWEAWGVIDVDYRSGVATGPVLPLREFLGQIVAEYRTRFLDTPDLAVELSRDGRFSTLDRVVPPALVSPIVSQSGSTEEIEADTEEFHDTPSMVTDEGFNPFVDPWYSAHGLGPLRALNSGEEFPIVQVDVVPTLPVVTALIERMKGVWEQFRTWLASKPVIRFIVGSAFVGFAVMALKYALTSFSGLFSGWCKPPKVLNKDQMDFMSKMTAEQKDVTFVMADAYLAKPFSPDFTDAEVLDWAKLIRQYHGVKMKVSALRQTETQSGHREPARNMLGIIPKQVTAGVASQGPVDYVDKPLDQQSQDIAKKATKNTWSLSLTHEGAETWLGQGLAVRDRVVLVATHYFSIIQRRLAQGTITNSDYVVFRNFINPALNQFIRLDAFLASERVTMVDRDLTLIRLPSLNAACDLVRHFLRAGDVSEGEFCDVRMHSADALGPVVAPVTQVIKTGRGRCMKGLIYEDPNTSTTIRVDDTFTYKIQTRNGDCGSPIFLENKSCTEGRKLVGVHIAGSTIEMLGYCSAVTQEALEKSLSEFKTVIVSQSGDWDGFTMTTDRCNYGTVSHMGDVPVPYSTTSKSSLFPSPLNNAWGPDGRMPARLSPFKNKDGDVVDPMHTAISLYGGPDVQFDLKALRRASHTAFSPFVEVSHEESRAPLTFEQACEGIPGESFFRGVKRSKSPGYPWNVRGHKNKKKFFGKEGPFDFSSPECAALREEVEKILAAAARGERLMHVFTDFLKDEVRAIEKVVAGKTRLISGAPLAYVIAFRMHFLPWMVAVQRHGLTSGVAVGINPYKDWCYLARRLRSKGPRCFAGDYKAFDACAKPQVQDEILHQVQEWYSLGGGGASSVIRTVLWQEVSFSRHLSGEGNPRYGVYQWMGSLPSGHPATSIINSFYNLILFVLSWEKCAGIHLTHRFWDYVYVCTYGDDNVVNVSPEVTHLFNQNTVADSMRSFGQTYTREDKLFGAQSDFRTLDQISFLKRTFREEDGMCLAPKDLQSTLYTPYWLSNRNLADVIVHDTVEETFLELSLHSPEIWDQWFPVIKAAAWERIQHVPKLSSRSHYQDAIMAMEYEW